ncbi:hypothetical protein BDB00DRAFT_306893 [Zychaea mexicana]|uniref:uncharacterized protein n=1 Tax=Zychaea mexicana TaxID=64656 RepID=UPI0022FEE2B8|nr:uncharacterized protein BDB00DRAFT_306893 [Zychaea mexicana]KAI9494512.1 hypothetical protein BDB00DRAFT_306893 [Zychaea mexicana]
MDAKTPLLPTSASAPAEKICCRHRRLSRWALVISMFALAHAVFQTLRCSFSHHARQVTAPSSPYYALDEGSFSEANFCYYDPSDPWETITSEYTVPASAFHGLDIDMKDSRYINYQ